MGKRFTDIRFEKTSISFGKVFLDALFLVLSFMLVYFLKYRNLDMDSVYIHFFPLLFGCWFFSSFLSSKFRPLKNERRYLMRLKPFLASAFIFSGLLSLFIYGLEWYSLSRVVVFGTLGIYFILEILFLSGAYIPLFEGKTYSETTRLSFFFLILDFLMLNISFFMIHYFKTGSLVVASEYQVGLLIIYFSWMILGLMIHRFSLPKGDNFFTMIWPFAKSQFFLISIISFMVFGLRSMSLSRLLVFGTIGGFALFEIGLVTILYFYYEPHTSDAPIFHFFKVPVIETEEVIEKVVEKEKHELEKYNLPQSKLKSVFLSQKLREVYLKESPQILRFIDEAVNLSKIDIVKAEVMNTSNPFNIAILASRSLEFLINIRPLNSFRRINKYLSEVNRKMRKNGIFISKFEPAERRYIYFEKKYSFYLAEILFFFDYLWKRIFPKLPLLKKIYFAVTRGKNRVFSLAEGLGRLYYSGFEIISLEYIDQYVYFVVKKTAKPITDRMPSYGLFFKQARICKHGQIKYIYKVRTMHPFSEFIHKYVFERNKLDESGKIKDDFRVSSWGKFFRKLWLDELPMLLNLVKGDIKLVGVRPLSETMFNAYPKELQAERIKFRPGLIPPYYADMPKSIEEVWASEERYLKQYARHPFKTDIHYLFKALKNIIIHKVKSG